ncbi:hypothetical protein SMACR_04605 [Sordaria macrospora]|uniref:Uncharacterized protein n=1 Tax=Sordaria macrospora TaxID=5147 RepID=A0A8S9A3K7_SORMA|nr:hypothetical protein SMACR_04605 [Sordaria macrospora]
MPTEAGHRLYVKNRIGVAT